ncbi:MAG: hypothetical protein H8E66_33985 [Planctomycetes bacterium]|nr:hypothetical protein [Planctomycetota bacterium]
MQRTASVATPENRLDKDAIKQAASGRWSEILSNLAGISADVLDGKHHPCPKCDGDDRFRMIDEDAGALFCNQCFSTGNGDGIAALGWLTGWDFPTTLREVAAYLGVAEANGTERGDPLDKLARMKRVSVESLVAYGAKINKQAVVFPAYDEMGQQCTTFKIIPTSNIEKLRKGVFEKDKPAGLFLPHEQGAPRLPKPGKLWIAVEGLKDAAALSELEFLAVGLNTNQLAAKFVRLFREVRMLVIPDRDTKGIDGAENTARRLYGAAESIRIGHLPSAIKPKNGDDVRDILATKDGEQLVRQTIDDAREWRPPTDNSELPKVALPGGDDKVCTTSAELGRLMTESGRYFARGGALCRLDTDDHGASVLTQLKPASLPAAFEGVAKLVKRSTDGEGGIVESPTTCSESTARLILHSEPFIAELPPIRVLTQCPVLIERDGELIEVSEYDRESGVMAGGWSAEDVSLEDARRLLAELLQDFRFASASDASRAAAAFITPALVFGGLLGGRPPIDLGEADFSQSGKGFRNKLTTAIYGHSPRTVTQRRDRGVGSLEESFDTVLIKGASFISLDNMRGKIDSPSIESFMTEDHYQARMPFMAPVDIDPRRIVVMMTSNRAEITIDLANRSSCTLILKQADGYKFAEYQIGDILDHVQRHRARYLGAVFAIIREWHSKGKPQTDETRHDFRKWARTLDWIVQEVLGFAPLLDGHRMTQERMCSPALSWLREVALLVRQAKMLGKWMRPYEILDLLEDHSAVEMPGLKDDGDDLSDEKVRQRILQAIGRRLKQCFKDKDQISIDAIDIERHDGQDEQYRKYHEYRFSEIDRENADSDKPRYDPAIPARKSFFSIQADSTDTHNINIVDPSGYSGYSGYSGVDSADDNLPVEPDDILPDGREVYTI